MKTRTSNRPASWASRFTIAAALTAAFAAGASGQQNAPPRPSLLAIYPAGGQRGSEIVVKITESSDLAEAGELVFSHPGIQAQPMMKAVDRFYPDPRVEPNQFRVSISSETPPGIYEVRAIGRYGVSNVRRFQVGAVAEFQEEEDNNDRESANSIQINSVTNGTFGVDYDFFQFAAKQNQTLIVHCAAEQLDSRGDAVLSILSSAGAELARVHDGDGLDPVIAFTPPADGDYFVRVNDLTYASDGANQTAPYRLTVRRGPWIDMIEPPVIPAGRRSEVVIYGRNLGGKPSDYYVDGQRLESLSVEISAPQRGSSTGALIHTPTELACPKFIYRHELNGVVANPVCIALTKQPTLAEQEPNDKLKTAQTVTLPADIVGSFGTANDRDGFVFAAKRGEKIWIEAQSRVLRQPTDVALVVQQLTEKDGEWSARDLTTVDDVASPGGNFRLPLSEDDPATLFTVPQDGKFRVLLREQLGATAGAPPRFYRLRIKAPEPAFQVVGGPGVWLSANTSNNQQLQPRSCVVRPGAAEEITLFAYRREGHRDEILVEAKGLPPQLVAEPAIVGPNVLLSSFMLRAKPDAEPWRGVISLVARSTVNGKEIEQPVGMLEILWTSPRNNRTPNPTRVTSGELFVAIDDSVVYPGRLEAPAQLRVARGGKIKVPVKMNKRLDSFKANVTVSAIGSLNRVTKRTASVTPDGKEVELELDVLQDATPGRFTFFLRGESDVDFEPFADLLKRAQDDQKRIDQISRDLAKAYQQATSEKRTADRVLQQANTLVSTAKSQRQAAESAKTQAEQRAKQAADRAKQGDTDALRDQAATAAKLAATAAEAATEKRRALEQAEQKLRAAKKQQAEADSAVTASKKIADEAAQQKRTADSVAQQAARTSRKRKLSAPFHSSLITLEIASLPIKHKFATRELVFKPGGEQSLAIAIEREFAFGDEVTFSLRQPSGFNSVRMASGKIEKNKNETTLNFTCDKKAKPGEYEAGVTVRLRYNNRTISEDVPLKLVVSSE